MSNVVALSNGFGKEIDLAGVMSLVVEQLGLSSDTKTNIIQELYNMKQGGELARKLSSDVEKIEVDVNDLIVFKNDAIKTLEKAEDFTDCFYNHADARKSFDNHVHQLTYRFTGDNTDIKDKLFHSIITRNCKANVTKSLNVGEVGRIKVSDLDMAKRLADCYMTSFQVDSIINKTIKSWQQQKLKGSLRSKVAIDLLDKYIEQENEKMMSDIEKKLNNI